MYDVLNSILIFSQISFRSGLTLLLIRIIDIIKTIAENSADVQGDH